MIETIAYLLGVFAVGIFFGLYFGLTHKNKETHTPSNTCSKCELHKGYWGKYTCEEVQRHNTRQQTKKDIERILRSIEGVF